MVTTQSAELSETTHEWLGATSIEHRKRLGQYMTPRVLRDRLLDHCEISPGMRVLDPGVGTGEFLRGVLDREPSARVSGWDVDPAILDHARRLVPESELTSRSALDPYQGPPFDLVIGNPPYFQFGASKEVRTYFAQVISGRVNIFSLFFQAGIEALRHGGQLAYVVPPSMNNGAYFERLREYIVERCDVEYLEVFTDQTLFDQAQTPVQLLVLKLGATDTGRHVFRGRSASSGFQRVIFSENPTDLAESFEGRRTLYDLGYEAVTGSIVWNQHKDALIRRHERSSVPLIWAHNIGAKGLKLDEEHKRPQYIRTEVRPLTGPAIVTNRIVGAVGAGDLRTALVPAGMDFVGENHVNVIRQHGAFEPLIPWSELAISLRRPGVGRRARLLTGNTQLSATELTHLLPLD